MNKEYKIKDLKIGGANKCFIIAELSANHNGSKEIALETVRAAKRAGADCIKLQTFKANTITMDCKNDDFRIKQNTIWDGKFLFDLYSETSLPWDWHQDIFDLADELGLVCFSSPFDHTAVDFLEKLNVPAYKIASYEITDIPLIEYAASKGKPMIMSTGIADDKDIKLAIEACLRQDNDQIILLKCTSSYPAPVEEANLAMISDFKERFGVVSGLSDHTLGSVVPIVAVSLGAKVIEKHFILDDTIGGADSSFSMTEKDFKKMVASVRIAESALGTVTYNLTQKQIDNRDFARSLYVVEDIEKGERFTAKNVRSIRPGFGLHPKYYNKVLESNASRDLERGTPLSLSFID